MQNWSKLVFVLIICNSLIVTGEKKNPTLSFLRYRVVPARQVPFPDSPEGSPGNGTWLAGTTLSRRMTAWDSLSPWHILCYIGIDNNRTENYISFLGGIQMVEAENSLRYVCRDVWFLHLFYFDDADMSQSHFNLISIRLYKSIDSKSNTVQTSGWKMRYY